MKSRFDLNKLKTTVFERTGQKISDDDPIFASVALNEAILDEFLIQAAQDMQETSEHLMLIIGVLQKAGDEYQKHVTEFINSQTSLINQQIMNDVYEAKKQFAHDTNEATKATLIAIEKTVKKTIDDQITNPVHRSVKALRQSRRENLIISILCGVAGGLLVMIFMTVINRANQEELLDVQEKPKTENVRKK